MRPRIGRIYPLDLRRPRIGRIYPLRLDLGASLGGQGTGEDQDSRL